MTPDTLPQLASERRHELLLEASRERLATPFRVRRVRRRRPSAASIGHLLAARREALPR